MKLIGFLLLLFTSSFSALAENSEPKELIADANKLSSLLSDRFETETQRKYLKVEFEPRDRWAAESSYLVFISFEGRGGSNNFTQWVALFSSTSGDLPALESERSKNKYYLVAISEIGGKMWRGMEINKAAQKGAVVEIPFMFWKDGDPGCCPSGEGSGRIRFQDGKLFVE